MKKYALFLGFLFPYLLPGQYAAIDRHAQGAPAELSQNLPELAAYLIGPARNETEQARAIYTWVSSYLSYDRAAERQGKRINQHLQDILSRRQGLCQDYALLYAAVCREAGLSCAVVDGYAAPRLSRGRSLPEKPDHSWNAVYADGRWQLLDATWAGAKDELAHRYGTDYFFTKPEWFVLTHLPAQAIWQLLPCPLSAKQFEQSAESILKTRSTADSCLAYTDSIAHFLSLPRRQQATAAARSAHAFLPTLPNQQQLGHALIDEAAQLDEALAELPLPDSLDAVLHQREQAIARCQEASQLMPLQLWQQQLYAQLLLNQAILLHRLPDKDRAADITSYLVQARALLLSLPERDYYRSYALPVCERLLEEER